MKIFKFLFLLLISSAVYGQVKIGDNPNTIDTFSLLELESSNKAFVLTRVSNIEMNNMTPLNGALVYNTDEKCIFQYAGTWTNLCDTGTDNQQLSFDSNTNILSLVDGGTVDLSKFINTDDQKLSITNNILTLEDGGTIDLSNYLDNTDNQEISEFSLAGSILTITLENGNTQTVDIAAASSDDQKLSIDNNILTLEDGGTVDLNNYLDNTDNQEISEFSLAGSILTITLENGNTQTVDIAAASSDDQKLSITNNILTLEDGGTVDLNNYLDNTDNQEISEFSLAGSILTITLENGNTQTVDIASSSSDDQKLSITNNILTLEDGGTVDLSNYLDNTDNQEISEFSLAGSILTITLENGNTQTVDIAAANSDDQKLSIDNNILTLEDGGTVDLSNYLDNTDNQEISEFSLAGSILTITLENGNTQT
ncbi:hypothetical protein JBL43_13935, partial [Aureibaculum sp. A20]